MRFAAWFSAAPGERAALAAAAGEGEVRQAAHRDAITGEIVRGGLLDEEVFAGGAAWLPLTEPALLPSARARVAAALGLTEEDVRRIARCDTCFGEDGRPVASEDLSGLDHEIIRERSGGKALRAALARLGAPPDDGIVDRILVIPPVERPEVVSDGGTLVPGTIGRVYERIVGVARSRATYPFSFDAAFMAFQETLQDRLDDLDRVLRGEPLFASVPLDDAWAIDFGTSVAEGRNQAPAAYVDWARSWHELLRPGASMWDVQHYLDPLAVQRCAFVGRDALLLVLAHAVVLWDLERAAARFIAPGTTAAIFQVAPSEKTAWFVTRSDALPGLVALDLTTGLWLDRTDDLGPFPFAGYKDDGWSVFDPVARTRFGSRPVDNYKGGATLSPCGKYAWIHGDSAIVRLSDLSPQAHVAAVTSRAAPPARPSPEEVEEDDPIEEDEEEDDDHVEEDDDQAPEEYEGDGRRAVVLTQRGFLLFLHGTLVLRGAELGAPEILFEERAAHSAVALDREGRRLAIGRTGEVTLVDLDEGRRERARRSIPLGALEGELTLESVRDRVGGLTREVEAALLQRFGTRSGVAAATVEALVEPSLGPYLEPEVVVDEDLARRLLAALGEG